MKRWLVALFIVLIGVALTIVLISLKWKAGGLPYIERVTGISFSSNLSQVDVYDNAEFYVVAHAKLNKDGEAFASRNGFTSESVEIGPWIEVLKPENRLISYENDLRFLEGRNTSHRWLGVFDLTSGRLWMVVFYPDPSGTIP